MDYPYSVPNIYEFRKDKRGNDIQVSWIQHFRDGIPGHDDKDFTKHQKQIGELEVKINKIQNEIGDMVKTSDMDLKYAEDRLH